MSASIYSRSEDIRIESIVIAELKLRNVERQVFRTYFVEATHNSTLNQRPETFNRVGVDCTNDVLTSRVIDGAVIVFAPQPPIAGIGVGAQQTDAIGNRLANESFDSFSFGIFDNARHDIAFTFDCADDGGLAARAAPGSSIAFIQVPVFVVAADVGFINLDHAAELVHVALDQRRADLVAHQPRGFVGAESHIAHNLQCTDAFLGRRHQVHNFEPVAERLVSVFKDRPGDVGEPIAGLRSAIVALPVPRIAFQFGNLSPAAGTTDAFGPAAPDEIGATGFFVGEHALEIDDGELMDWLGLPGHDGLPLDGRIMPWQN